MKYLLLASLVLLSACSKPLEQTEHKVISVQQEKYIIVSVDQPKHFHVDLKHVETGHVFKDTASSKHCNRWQDYPAGTVIYVRTIRYENNTFSVDGRDANNVICG